MTAQAFPRLALVAACSAYLVALAVVWQQLGWQAATVAFTGGVVLALVVTVEPTPKTAVSLDVDGRQVDADTVRRLLHRRRRDTASFEHLDDDEGRAA